MSSVTKVSVNCLQRFIVFNYLISDSCGYLKILLAFDVICFKTAVISEFCADNCVITELG